MTLASYKIIHQNRGAELDTDYFDYFYYINYMGCDVQWTYQGEGVYIGTLEEGEFPQVSATCTMACTLEGLDNIELIPVISGNVCTIDTGAIMPKENPHFVDLTIYFNQ